MPRPLDVILSVAVGSALGGVARYLVTVALSSRWPGVLPVGTLVVNVAGCLLLGFLMRIMLDTAEFSPATRALLTTGFCGGFTTFSTFSWEAAMLINEGAIRRAALYITGSALFGLLAVWAGSAVAATLLTAIRGRTA